MSKHYAAPNRQLFSDENPNTVDIIQINADIKLFYTESEICKL